MVGLSDPAYALVQFRERHAVFGVSTYKSAAKLEDIREQWVLTAVIKMELSVGVSDVSQKSDNQLEQVSVA